MYQVHTLAGLCRFIAVPYYSMVHTVTVTGSYSVHTGMNSVHTTSHNSRCSMPDSDMEWLHIRHISHIGPMYGPHVIMSSFFKVLVTLSTVPVTSKQLFFVVLPNDRDAHTSMLKRFQ
jgi:hypothetical protein